jgi:hypothetical protein
MGSRFVYLLVFLTTVSAAWIETAWGQDAVPAQQFVRLVVIAPEEFLPPLRNYLAKRPAEVIGELVSLKAVLAEGQGMDDAEKVKRWLFEKWNSDKFNHVLLVGDADLFPVRYMVLPERSLLR